MSRNAEYGRNLPRPFRILPPHGKLVTAGSSEAEIPESERIAPGFMDAVYMLLSRKISLLY